MLGFSFVSMNSMTTVAAASSLTQDFEWARQAVQPLDVSQQDQLKLYGWFKQATVGDVQGKRPGVFDMRARFKYDAWSSVKGLSRDEAMQSYVDFVKALLAAET